MKMDKKSLDSIPLQQNLKSSLKNFLALKMSMNIYCLLDLVKADLIKYLVLNMEM